MSKCLTLGITNEGPPVCSAESAFSATPMATHEVLRNKYFLNISHYPRGLVMLFYQQYQTLKMVKPALLQPCCCCSCTHDLQLPTQFNGPDSRSPACIRTVPSRAENGGNIFLGGNPHVTLLELSPGGSLVPPDSPGAVSWRILGSP